MQVISGYGLSPCHVPRIRGAAYTFVPPIKRGPPSEVPWMTKRWA